MKLTETKVISCDRIVTKDGSVIYKLFVDFGVPASNFGNKMAECYTSVDVQPNDTVYVVRVNGKYKVITNV